MRARRRPASVCAAALTLMGASAFAQSPAACGDVEIQRGNELRRGARDDEALVLFRQAWDACHTTRALGQMGLAAAALGRWLEANRCLTAALTDVGDPWIARNREQLEVVRAQVMSHVGTLEVSGGVAGAEVLVDGRRVGSLPLAAPVLVAGGSVNVQVRAEGYLPFARSVMVPPGETVRQGIELVARPTEVPARAASLPVAPVVAVASSDPPRTLAWVTAVGGVLLIGGGGAALAWRESAVSDQRNLSAAIQCFEDDDRAACVEAQDGIALPQALAIAGFAAGAALVATSVVLFVTAPRSTPRPTSAVCGPGPVPLGLSCGLSF